MNNSNENIALYIHFNGVNNATTAKDYSANEHVPTFNGNAKISNTEFFCDEEIWRVFPAIAHELTHRQQFKLMGWLRYMSLSFPLLRKYTIEPEAYTEQDRVNLLIT